MLVYIVYVVQVWNERYEYWSDVVEPSPTMFGLSTVGYDTEDVGQAKLSALREAYPTVKYQLVRRTTTTEEIA